MFEVSTVGVDLAKNVIQIHGVAVDGKVVVRRQLRRSQFLLFFEGRPRWTCPDLVERLSLCDGHFGLE